VIGQGAVTDGVSWQERERTGSLGLGVDQVASGLVGGIITLGERVEGRETTGLKGKVSISERNGK
jgi:hypothetical protein